MALLINKNIGKGIICSYFKIGGVVVDSYNKILIVKIHGYVDETYRNEEKTANKNNDLATELLNEINELSAIIQTDETLELQSSIAEKSDRYNELILSDDRGVDNTVYTADYDLAYSENISITDIYGQLKLLPDLIGATDI